MSRTLWHSSGCACTFFRGRGSCLNPYCLANYLNPLQLYWRPLSLTKHCWTPCLAKTFHMCDDRMCWCTGKLCCLGFLSDNPFPEGSPSHSDVIQLVCLKSALALFSMPRWSLWIQWTMSWWTDHWMAFLSNTLRSALTQQNCGQLQFDLVCRLKVSGFSGVSAVKVGRRDKTKTLHTLTQAQRLYFLFKHQASRFLVSVLDLDTYTTVPSFFM